MESKKTSPADHMANERTFLAWIRTSIGIMAFGFVIERFTLFLSEFSATFLAYGRPMPQILSPSPLASLLGFCLMILGCLLMPLTFVAYCRNRWRIDNGHFSSNIYLPFFLTFALSLVGLFLIFWLSTGYKTER